MLNTCSSSSDYNKFLSFPEKRGSITAASAGSVLLPIPNTKYPSYIPILARLVAERTGRADVKFWRDFSLLRDARADEKGIKAMRYSIPSEPKTSVCAVVGPVVSCNIKYGSV